MSKIPNALRQTVIERAGNRCEYCQLSQLGQAATFHIDHIVPIAAGGPTILENLALACVACSLYKAAKQEAEDPETKEIVPLFNPRCQKWEEHFSWGGVKIIGLTPTGQATSLCLRFNRPMILAIRAEEAKLGRHPP